MFSHDPFETIIFTIVLVMGTHHEYEGNERETMALLSLDCDILLLTVDHIIQDLLVMECIKHRYW